MADEFEQIGSFLSRWSRRKLDKTEAAPPATQDAPAGQSAQTSEEPAVEIAAEGTAEPLPDVDSLTPESDFTPFMQSSVDPGMKTAALKQLFKDPHFNVMDGLDTYIDDYGKPDPLPEGMLRQMVQSRFLGLFDDEKKTDEPSVAAATPAPADPKEEASNEDADLRLQPHHAADAGEPGAGGPGAGEDAAGQP